MHTFALKVARRACHFLLLFHFWILRLTRSFYTCSWMNFILYWRQVQDFASAWITTCDPLRLRGYTLSFVFIRNRLSYEQFAIFLANVKELNAHKQTKDVNYSRFLSHIFLSVVNCFLNRFVSAVFLENQETLRKTDEVFGPENKDLYTIFEGLITRNVHWNCTLNL